MTRPVEPRAVGPLADAPLRLALVQVRTRPVLALERPETVERLLEVLQGWELTDRQSNVELAVSLGPGGAIEQQQGRPETVWVLNAPSQQFRAVLSASSVAVECERYSLWPDFDEALRAVFSAVAEVATPSHCVRFGMRYVNELRDATRLSGEPGQLTELLAEELVAVPLSLGSPVVGSLAELRVREEFGVLAVRHGLVEPGRYLLDMDAYNEATSVFDVERLMDLASRFHARIESVFAWALAPEYLSSLSEPAGETTDNMELGSRPPREESS